MKTEEFEGEKVLMLPNGIKSITQRLFWHFSEKCGVSVSESKPSASSQHNNDYNYVGLVYEYNLLHKNKRSLFNSFFKY